MQDSYRKLVRKHWSIAIIIVFAPILLYAVLPILPTHDDWAGTTKPDFNQFFIKEHFFFYGYHWRPFDTWIGYIVGRNPQILWPTFNHIIVVIGHLFCSIALYRLLNILGFTKTANNIILILSVIIVVLILLSLVISKEKLRVLYKPFILAGIALLIIRIIVTVLYNSLDMNFNDETQEKIIISIKDALLSNVDKFI